MNLSLNERPARRVRSRVAWGAIFAGMLVAVAFLLLLGALMAAVDVSVGTESVATWMVGLSIVCMFLGGWTTSRLSDGETVPEAAFYGIIVWSATALLLLYLAINGVLVMGSGTLLGQSADDETFFPLAQRAAWLGFAAMAISLLATVAGSIAGLPGHPIVKRRLFQRRRSSAPAGAGT